MISCSHFGNTSKRELSNADSLIVNNKSLKCVECEATLRIHVCVQCQRVACSKHLNHKDHTISFCIEQNEFFCTKCREYIVFENDSRKYDFLPALRKRKIEDGNTHDIKRLRTTEEFKQPLLELADAHDPTSHESYNYIGLRGLNNLGNTCFMNCILQSLCHNPLLRNYYLGLAKPAKHQDHKGHSVGLELQTLMSELYKGETKPYNPHCFLYTMWNVAGHLAGYHQQDAHEFLMAILGALSTPDDFLSRKTTTSEKKGVDNIADLVFRGELRSDVNCLQCGHTSSTFDPFLDISLHLRTDLNAKEDENTLRSLYDCLKRYTRKEKLGRDVYTCDKCSTKQETTIQLTIKTLPIVICFHLKRFEHGFVEKKKSKTTKQESQKIDDFIEFPMEIDMMPYTSRGINDGVKNSKVMYSLFSVVQHVGSMESGHYTCYVKHNNQWFLCDDSTVYIANEDDVTSCQAYLLFYVRQTLNYK